MSDMLRDVKVAARGNTATVVNVDALKSEIRLALINQKANACPIACRMAWHMAGTYDKRDGTGGSNGGTIRFEPESTDKDNAGLSIIRDLLQPVMEAHPEITHADLYTLAGCVAIEFLGGPKIPFNMGRSDHDNGSKCPANGRLPDAAQGADHLRKVFGERMGFSDQEIVALSGAHTLGRCHRARSGFDGPWTTHPLRFDNEYFRNLVNLEWQQKKWNGPPQFEDTATGSLMMLPTDIALVKDDKFKPWVELYARDQEAFFRDFASAYGKLLALGCPAACAPASTVLPPSARDKASAEFREHAMHGSVLAAKRVAPQADVHQVEATSGRTALHKAAFWGHNDMVKYLVKDVKLNVNAQDFAGDTAVHDAAKFGHAVVVQHLLEGGAKASIRNKQGHTALDVARRYKKDQVAKLLAGAKSKL